MTRHQLAFILLGFIIGMTMWAISEIEVTTKVLPICEVVE